MGTGTIVAGLAAVMMGEALYRGRRLWAQMLWVWAGAVLYRLVIAWALASQSLGLQPGDVNLLTAAMVAATMIFSESARRRRRHGSA
jgi:putative ABC transport system permease protein